MRRGTRGKPTRNTLALKDSIGNDVSSNTNLADTITLHASQLTAGKYYLVVRANVFHDFQDPTSAVYCLGSYSLQWNFKPAAF